MTYKFDIKWVSANNNPTDYLSRLSIQSKQIDIEANTNYINFINDESNWILDWFKIKKKQLGLILSFQKSLIMFLMIIGQMIPIKIQI